MSYRIETDPQTFADYASWEYGAPAAASMSVYLPISGAYSNPRDPWLFPNRPAAEKYASRILMGAAYTQGQAGRPLTVFVRVQQKNP